MIGLIGKKIGMTRIFLSNGISIPVSLIHIKKNYIVQIKSIIKDGYNAIQLTTNITKKANKPKKGHFLKAGLLYVGKKLWECKINNISSYKIGDFFTIKYFNDITYVDVTGYSKGKGFAGTVKRWNFSLQDATHGNSLSHRVPGSIGQNQSPGRVFKGKKMAGHLGNEKNTIQNLIIKKIDLKHEILFIKGAIPGFINSLVLIRPAIKK